MKKKLNALDLFSGIGGISYGLKGLTQPLTFVEIDEKCIQVLKRLFSEKQFGANVNLVNDVRKTKEIIDTVKGRDVDLIISSSSCVGFSTVGSQKGLEHEETLLFLRIFELMDTLHPPLVFMENVPNILSSNDGRDYAKILEMFCARGYDLTWGVYSAEDVGAWHRRRRWYCLAVKKDTDVRDFVIGSSDNNCVFDDLMSKWLNGPDDKAHPVEMIEREFKPPGCYQRLKMMGNAVVPQTVRAAFANLYESSSELKDPRCIHRLVLQDREKRKEGAVKVRSIDLGAEHVNFPSYGFFDCSEQMLYIKPPPVKPFEDTTQFLVTLDPNLAAEMEKVSAPKKGSKPVTNAVYKDPIVIKKFATPRAKNLYYCRVLTHRCIRDLGTQLHFAQNDRLTDEARTGIVNPCFVEFLMGYPTGWTRL